jgi:quercetin 2,3-dioxygenase
MTKLIITGHSTIDGAGVKLFRVFSNELAKQTDPFLLLDNFGSDRPEDYIRGFPWHPHRGIETVTYMLEGEVDHEDNIGNKGVINSGDIQWMTAGSGILHQEMPKTKKGMMRGFQLWVNLPKKNKMMQPRYRGILKDEVPFVKLEGLSVKVIAGSYEGKKGPVKDLVVDAEYFDISLDKGKIFSYSPKKAYTTICYIIDGSGSFDDSILKKGQCLLLKDIGNIEVKSMDNLRFLLISGKPLNEPISWGGPIVMNTQEELELAYRELEEGTFIKKAKI